MECVRQGEKVEDTLIFVYEEAKRYKLMIEIA